ncbi:hypothetical protein QTP88_008480 [Uroleucon formosanum]
MIQKFHITNPKCEYGKLILNSFPLSQFAGNTLRLSSKIHKKKKILKTLTPKKLGIKIIHPSSHLHTASVVGTLELTPSEKNPLTSGT